MSRQGGEPLIIDRATRGEVNVMLKSGIRGAGYLVDRVVDNAPAC
jgi:hypothetical protein